MSKGTKVNGFDVSVLNAALNDLLATAPKSGGPWTYENGKWVEGDAADKAAWAEAVNEVIDGEVLAYYGNGG